MASSFTINENLVNEIHQRIYRAISEVIKSQPYQFRLFPFLYDVVVLEIYPKVTALTLKTFLEICFWASLEKEEGTFSNFSVALQPPNPDDFQFDLRFKKKIEFNITNLKKLAPAFSPGDYQIGVWFDQDNGLEIWGVSKKLLWFLSISSITPGKLLFNCLSGTDNSFKCPITSFDSGFISTFSLDSNPLYEWLTRESKQFSALMRNWDIQRVLLHMFNYGRGGAILLVRENNQSWRKSTKEISYENVYLSKFTYEEITSKYELYKEIEIASEKNESRSELEKENFRHQISSRGSDANKSLNAISKLTKVDGATILSENLNLIAFGVKIQAQELSEVIIAEPFEGSETERVNKTEWKVGTRHTSAAEFVNEQPDSLAIVVSEDRKVSVISWDESQKSVKVTKNFEWMIFN